MVPQKASGGGGRSRGGGGGGRIPHFNWSIYRGGNFFFFFFFFFSVSGLKLDEKSIENGLEGQKFLVVCLFWGGCHHPNRVHLVACCSELGEFKQFAQIVNVAQRNEKQHALNTLSY